MSTPSQRDKISMSAPCLVNCPKSGAESTLLQSPNPRQQGSLSESYTSPQDGGAETLGTEWMEALSSEATGDTARDGAKKHETINKNAAARMPHETALLFRMRERSRHSSKGRDIPQNPSSIKNTQLSDHCLSQKAAKVSNSCEL